MIRRRSAGLRRLALSCLAFICGCSEEAQPEGVRPPPRSAPPNSANIIFILTDDQAPDTTGAAGNALIRTPNLDRMAAEGAFFSRAYNVIPQCAPSRAVLLTGLYPHVHGPLSNERAGLKPGVDTVATLLKSQGYRCGLVGKWHLNVPHGPLVKQAGFDDYWVAYSKDDTEKADKYTRPTIVANGKPLESDRFLTDLFTDYAIEFIDRSEPRPFFLWLAYHAPHTPITPHPDFPYDAEQMPLPASIHDDLSTKPAAQRRGTPHRTFTSLPQAALKRERADYYSMISAIDANVGRLLAHLRARGLAENTLVVFMSDNGWMIGEHQMSGKGSAVYEELVRTPLIFWQPGAILPASSAALVSSIDIFPTLVARGGAAPPGGRAGHDLWPLITGQAARLRDAVFIEYQQKNRAEFTPILAIVTAQHKYARYLAGDDEELYDLAADPLELNNLVDAPEHRATLENLRARVDRFQNAIERPFWIR